MRTVSWSGGHSVVLDGLDIILATSPEAEAEAERALGEPVQDWAPGDEVIVLHPGEDGFVELALKRLDGMIETGD